MIPAKLTIRPSAAHKEPMRFLATRWVRAMLLLGMVPVGGCISLETPTDPIVIELNINITQEVIYRLAEDAGNTIDENADIF